MVSSVQTIKDVRPSRGQKPSFLSVSDRVYADIFIIFKSISSLENREIAVWRWIFKQYLLKSFYNLLFFLPHITPDWYLANPNKTDRGDNVSCKQVYEQSYHHR